MADRVTVEMTTGIGTFSFPHVFKETAEKKKDGTLSYETQFLIPKSDRETLKAIIAAIQKVGKAKWGDNWKKVRNPLRDGDKEADELTEDGALKRDKYPERLGHYFLNARSTKPIGVVDRQRDPIVDTDAIYAGCKGKIAVSFYPYSKEGNHGIGCGLNGVQKVADGEPIGGGAKPAVESMFDLLDEDDDLGLDMEDFEDEEVEETPPPAKKKAAKKAPAKKTAAKKRKPEPVEDEDDDLIEDDDEFEDLEDDDI